MSRLARMFRAAVARRERLRYAQHGERWITIGGGPDGKGGQHAGGTPVRVNRQGQMVVS